VYQSFDSPREQIYTTLIVDIQLVGANSPFGDVSSRSLIVTGKLYQNERALQEPGVREPVEYFVDSTLLPPACPFCFLLVTTSKKFEGLKRSDYNHSYDDIYALLLAEIFGPKPLSEHPHQFFRFGMVVLRVGVIDTREELNGQYVVNILYRENRFEIYQSKLGRNNIYSYQQTLG
jgi:hypothetical protein